VVVIACTDDIVSLLLFTLLELGAMQRCRTAEQVSLLPPPVAGYPNSEMTHHPREFSALSASYAHCVKPFFSGTGCQCGRLSRYQPATSSSLIK
jgi:hypothetical protein